MSPAIRRIHAAAAVLACTAAMLSACTFPGLGGESGPKAAVSKEEATRVFNNYVQASNAARKARDKDRLPRIETGPQLPVSIGKYKIADYHRDSDEFRLDPLEFEAPTFFIPRFEKFPKWFAAVAAPTGGGPPQAMIFIRDTDREAWRAAYAVVVDVPESGGDKDDKDGGDGGDGGGGDGANGNGGEQLPRIAVDGDGLASVLPPGRKAERSPIRPVQLPDAHASLNQYGPSGLGAGIVAAGPRTTGVAETVARDVRLAKRRGFTYVRSYHASGFPIYALQTYGGGALVWYSVTDELSVTRARGRARTPLRMASDVAGIIRRTKVTENFQASSLHQYLAVVPPDGGRAKVIGSFGGPVGGVGR